MTRVAVVSSVYGGHDVPVFVEQSVDCRYVMVTDGSVDVPDGWEHVVVDRSEMHPRLAAKFAKCMPWEFVDADVWVWLDGSIVPTADMVEKFLDALGDGQVAQFPHPDRVSLRAEALVSMKLAKYQGLDLLGQVRHYVEGEHPDDWGLWATGLMVWRDCEAVRDMGWRWFKEILAWSIQDQLSQPVVLRQCGLRPVALPGRLRSNPLFRIRDHVSDL